MGGVSIRGVWHRLMGSCCEQIEWSTMMEFQLRIEHVIHFATSCQVKSQTSLYAHLQYKILKEASKQLEIEQAERQIDTQNDTLISSLCVGLLCAQLYIQRKMSHTNTGEHTLTD